MISAVIDIGSNSIKLLVAQGANAEPIFETISETRLSPNDETARERIPEAAFADGLQAVCALMRKAREFSPAREAVVGTSLFRTAENGGEFAAAIKLATGTPMRILSGTEEAELVAEGVATDPAVSTPCAIFDLGGGSLEFIAKADAKSPIFAVSRPLGAVRLTRKFLTAPTEKISAEEIFHLREHVKQTLAEFLPQKIPENAVAVFCGGSAGIAARLLSEKNSSAGIPVPALEELLETTTRQTLRERAAHGVPEKRADIFPAALAALTEICALGNFSRFLHSRRNLRYGLCARLNAGAR